jgi:septum formation protein
MVRLEPQRAGGAQREWILASGSPRRIELLHAAGQRFEIDPSRVDESPRHGETAFDLAARVALEKARAVAARHPGRWVLGADTLVVLGGEPLGKPRDAIDARTMLARLSGGAHDVVTAFVLLDPRGHPFVERSIRTEVLFRELSSDEIDRYVATREPLDKAGGYAIQGGARKFVTEVRGSLSNVIGLPMNDVESALRAAGLWIAASRVASSPT